MMRMNTYTPPDKYKASSVVELGLYASTLIFEEKHVCSTNQYSMDSFPKTGILCHLRLLYIVPILLGRSPLVETSFVVR